MSKSKAVSTRLKENEIKRIEQIAKKEHIDRSALLRKFVLTSLKNYFVEESAKNYQKGLISLAEAATQAEVSIWEMMDYIQLHNIRPPPEDPSNIEKELI